MVKDCKVDTDTEALEVPFSAKRGGFEKSLLVPWILVFAFFLVAVVLPLAGIFITPRLSDFKSVFSSSRFFVALKNTAVECVFSTTISVLIGYIFAYAASKTRIFGRKLFSFVPLMHLVTPPFVGGLSFILLFGRQGFITHRLLGLDISLYGFWGLLLAQSLCFFPVAFLICLQTLKNINPSLEQSAVTLGASKTKIFFTVTLPLSMQGILASFLFIAVSILSDFGNPLIVGGRFRVLAVEIYTQLTGWVNKGEGAVLGLVLVAPSIALFLIQNKITKKQGLKMATIGGKGNHAEINFSSDPNAMDNAPRWLEILCFVVCSFVSILVFAQFLAIIVGSFQKLWGIDTSFTLDHVKALKNYSAALRNSLFFALISATVSTILALLSSFFVHRTTLPFSKPLDAICQIPSAVPGTLYGISLSLFAATLKLPLSKISPLLIITAMTCSFLPFSYRIITSTFLQIHTTLDDSARSLGDSHLKMLFKILSPLSSGGISGSFIYDFIRGIGTLSSVIFLVSFHTPLASISILNLSEQGDWGKAAALAMVLTAITFAILGAVQVVRKSKQ